VDPDWLPGVLGSAEAEEVAHLAAGAVNDKEIYQGPAEAILLHLWLYHGPDIVLTEDEAKERILELIDWIKKRAE